MTATEAVQFALRFALAGALGLAGAMKLFDLDGFRRTFIEFGGPRRGAKVVSLLVPTLELAAAVALLPRATAFYGAVGAVGLLLMFTAAISLALVRGRAPSCRCFGQLRTTAVSWRTLARNGALLSAAVAIIAMPSAGSASMAAIAGGTLALGLLFVGLSRRGGQRRAPPADLPVVRTALTDAASTAFLRLAARLDCDPAHYRLLAATAARLDTWQGLASAAEAHGLAPLVSYHLSKAGIESPTMVRRELLAAAMVHGAANRARFHALGEILDAFGRASVPVVVLRGAALAHLLYSSLELRPVNGIDLLVAPELAPRAQELLAAIGFGVPLTRARPGRRMHHPFRTGMKVVAGVEAWVEIHTDAMTGDLPASLTMSQLTGATQSFLIDGRPARALGHADMLHHLCRHMAEPAKRMRLVWAADVVGYATRYRNDIPWAEMRRRYPLVLNALSLLDLVTPLPPELTEFVSPTPDRRIRGVGVVPKPPADTLGPGRPVRDILRDIFDPSDWWLHLYYGTGGGALLQWNRWVRHPWRVGGWFLRRSMRRLISRNT